jgi:hypothetical protein
MATVGQVKLSKKFKGLFLFETSCTIQFNVYRNDLLVFLYQITKTALSQLGERYKGHRGPLV